MDLVTNKILDVVSELLSAVMLLRTTSIKLICCFKYAFNAEISTFLNVPSSRCRYAPKTDQRSVKLESYRDSKRIIQEKTFAVLVEKSKFHRFHHSFCGFHHYIFTHAHTNIYMNKKYTRQRYNGIYKENALFTK